MCNETLLPWLNFIVLTLTLFVVFRYTLITNRLHQTTKKQLDELIKQRRLSVVPALLPQVLKHGNSHKLNLINIGNGVAVNICFDKVRYKPTEKEETFYEFDSIPMLRPSEHLIVPYKSYVCGRIEHPDIGLPHLTTENSSLIVILRIHFQNIEGEEYAELFQLGKEGSKLISLDLRSNSIA